MSGKLLHTTKGTLPAWVRLMAPDALMSAREVALLFGFSNQNSLESCVRCGSFPAPDVLHDKQGARYNRHHWTKTAVMAEWRRRHEANALPPPEQRTPVVMPRNRLDVHRRPNRTRL